MNEENVRLTQNLKGPGRKVIDSLFLLCMLTKTNTVAAGRTHNLFMLRKKGPEGNWCAWMRHTTQGTEVCTKCSSQCVYPSLFPLHVVEVLVAFQYC